MELRRYWSTIWHYRWLVLALPLIVGLVSSALWLVQPNSYKTTVKVQIALAPPQANADGEYFRYDNYYNYLATEYAVDDLVEVLNGNVFADAAAATLRSPEYGLSITNEMVRSSFKAQRLHRVLIADVTTGDKDRTVAIARAINSTIARDPIKYFTKGDLVPKQGAATLLVEAPLDAKGDRVRRALNVILQTAVALFAGLALAFLLDYLNERLRDAAGTREALDLPILGQIPRGATALAGRGRGRT